MRTKQLYIPTSLNLVKCLCLPYLPEGGGSRFHHKFDVIHNHPPQGSSVGSNSQWSRIIGTSRQLILTVIMYMSDFNKLALTFMLATWQPICDSSKQMFGQLLGVVVG